MDRIGAMIGNLVTVLPTLLLLSLLILTAVAFLDNAFSWLSFPYELDQNEGFILEGGWRLLNGLSLYGPLDDYPFVRMPYTPGFFLALVPTILLLGRDMLAGRIISLIAAIGCCAVISTIVHRVTGSRAAAFIAGLLPFSTRAFFVWAPLMRVDLLGALFTLYGLNDALHGNGRGRIIRSAVWFSLAFLTKQTYIAAPLAVALCLLRRDRVAFVRFTVLFSTIILVAVGWLTLATNGWFLAHTIEGNLHDPFDSGRMRYWVGDVLIGGHLPLLLVALEGMRRAPGILSVYFVIALLSCISAGNVGAVINHILQPLLAASILAGVSLATKRQGVGSALVASTILISLVLFQDVPGRLHHDGPSWNPWTNLESYDSISTHLGFTHGPVLTEYASFSFRNGHDVLLQPLTVSIFRSERTDLTLLRNDCDDGRFTLIVHKAFMGRLLRECIRTRYVPVATGLEVFSDYLGGSNRWTVYRYAPPSTDGNPPMLRYLSDMDPIDGSFQFGLLGRDRSVMDRPLRLGGLEYSKGISMNSNARVDYAVDGFSYFRAVIGIDDELDTLHPNYASAIFSVLLDDREVFRSEVMRQETPPRAVSVPLGDAKVLSLVVEDAGEGATGNLIWGDHGDWCDAWLVT